MDFPTDPSEKGYDPIAHSELATHKFYRVPHKDGEGSNCGNPLSKSYIKWFESDVLSSPYPSAKELLLRNAKCSYWVSSRSRINNQLIISPDPKLGMDTFKCVVMTRDLN
jgi:DNA polymerase gamma 1